MGSDDQVKMRRFSCERDVSSGIYLLFFCPGAFLAADDDLALSKIKAIVLDAGRPVRSTLANGRVPEKSPVIN